MFKKRVLLTYLLKIVNNVKSQINARCAFKIKAYNQLVYRYLF